MKFINVMKRYGAFAASVIGLGVASIGTASAALPAAVTDALSEAAIDSGLVGAGSLIAVVAAVSFKYSRRAL